MLFLWGFYIIFVKFDHGFLNTVGVVVSSIIKTKTLALFNKDLAFINN